jgi:hypothetical protein
MATKKKRKKATKRKARVGKTVKCKVQKIGTVRRKVCRDSKGRITSVSKPPKKRRKKS